MKRSAVSLAVLFALAAGSAAFGQADEIRRLQDIAGNAFDQAAAANENVALLQAKVDQQAERISALESQLAEINQADFNAAKAEADAKTAAAEAARRQAADEQWAAGAPERARQAATVQAAMAQWRASLPHTPNILVVPNRTTGGATVSVDGTLTEFKTVAEANAFAAAVKQKALAALALGPNQGR